MRKSERGFTLVELAIVLVIIGIILGGILKGKALIDNARTKRVEKDMRGVEAAMWTFYDRYGRFPGDCNKDGIVDAEMKNSLTALNDDPSAEFCPDTKTKNDLDMPWAELKKAEIFPIAEDNRDLTRNTFNGRFYIGYVMEDGTKKPQYNAIGILQIPCFAAKAIDQSIDGDVNGTSGSVRILLPDGHDFANGTDNNYDTICTTESTPIDIVYLLDKTP